MSGPSFDPCAVAQHQISLEIDCRLSAADARELAHHLRVCETCSSFRSQVHALHTRVERLPVGHGPVALAERVRALAAKRRARQRSGVGNRWQRAASILIGALSLLNAYGIGRHRLLLDGAESTHDAFARPFATVAALPEGSSISVGGTSVEPREELPSADEPPSPAPEEERAPQAVAANSVAERSPTEPIVEPNEAQWVSDTTPTPSATPIPDPSVAVEPDAYIARASRALLSDLAVLDEIPQDQRVPLIRAQMKRFGITEWISEESTKPQDSIHPSELAKVMQRVQDALDAAQPETALHRLQVDPEVGIVFASLRAIGPIRDDETRTPRPDASQIVADVAAKLGATERLKLEELLRFKESWIEGSYGPAVRVATGAADDHERMDLEPFGASLRVAVVSALTEAGGTRERGRGRRAPPDQSIRVPFKPIEFMHLENARFDVGHDGNGVTIRVDYGGDR